MLPDRKIKVGSLGSVREYSTKVDLIVRPEHWDSGTDDVPDFISIVDGVHFQIEEPNHPML
eukprot:scaffold23026_cov47-Attheya_sp.AAC.1